MVDLTELHIQYYDFKGVRRIKKVKPSQPTDKLAIQQDIGEALRKLRDTGKYEYYYVIAVINRDGKPAYRPVVPKTMF